MNISPIDYDPTSDFSLVHMKSDCPGTMETPHCKKHGAMLKMTADGIWRCETVVGFEHGITGKSKWVKERETICRAACVQIS